MACSGVPQEKQVTADLLLSYRDRHSPNAVGCSQDPNGGKGRGPCAHTACWGTCSASGCACAIAHMQRSEYNLGYGSSPSTLKQDLFISGCTEHARADDLQASGGSCASASHFAIAALGYKYTLPCLASCRPRGSELRPSCLHAKTLPTEPFCQSKSWFSLASCAGCGDVLSNASIPEAEAGFQVQGQSQLTQQSKMLSQKSKPTNQKTPYTTPHPD